MAILQYAITLLTVWSVYHILKPTLRDKENKLEVLAKTFKNKICFNAPLTEQVN